MTLRPRRTWIGADENLLRYGALGAGSGVYVHVFGQVYLSEIVFFLLLPFALLGWNPAGRRFDFRAVHIALWMWFAGLVLGGLVVSSSTAATTIQYCAGAAVTSISLFVLNRIVVFDAQLIALAFGFGIGQFLAVLLQTSVVAEVNPWKFGLGSGVAVILLVFNRTDRVARLGLIVVAALSLAFDNRSLALISLGAVTLTVVADLSRRRLRTVPLILTFLAMLAVVGAAVSEAYSYLIRSNWLGADASVKFDAQGHGSPLLVLLGGRDELFFSLRAVWHHAILGVGSRPILSFDDANAGLQTMQSLGLQPADPLADAPGAPLPTHSFLVGGWAYGGVLGLLCWVFILLVVLRRTAEAARAEGPRRHLTVFLGVFALWNILYSPYGGSERFQLALTLVLLFRMTTPAPAMPKEGALPRRRPRPGPAVIAPAQRRRASSQPPGGNQT